MQDLRSSGTRISRITLTRTSNLPLEKQLPEICSHAGVRTVVEAILQSRKPLVGFQTMGDLAFMIGSIYKALPRRLEGFFALMKELHVLVDLKTILGLECLQDLNLKQKSLSEAFGRLKEMDCGEPSIVSELAKEGGAAHDVGENE